MVMSQGTYTFLACFAGFWSVWALIVMLCCFCSFLQRRIKRRQESRLREQCLRTLEMDSSDCHGGPVSPPLLPTREAPQFSLPQTLPPPAPLHVPYPLPQAHWITTPDTEVFGKPPCYEDAVLMEDPPPPYSEVLADPRATFLKPAAHHVPPFPLPQREPQAPPAALPLETSKPPPAQPWSERSYSSLIRLPSSRRWDSLSRLLTSVDLNHNNLPAQATAAMATMPRREARTHPESVQDVRGLEPTCGMPTVFPLLGRSTAV